MTPEQRAAFRDYYVQELLAKQQRESCQLWSDCYSDYLLAQMEMETAANRVKIMSMPRPPSRRDCFYDHLTERYSECDSSTFCKCPRSTSPSPRKVTPLPEQLLTRRLKRVREEFSPLSRTRILLIGAAGLFAALAVLAAIVLSAWRR